MAEEKKKKKHAGHGFTHVHAEHHKDGSATVHFRHQDGPEHDVKHAVASIDHLHDSLQTHLGTPNPGEAEADAGSEVQAAQAAGAAPGPAMGV